jgi:TatD DNase family protein
MPPLLIDTHCHLNFDTYEPDRAEVVARAAAAGVTRIIIPGVDVATTREALALAAQYPSQVFAAAGVHPNSTADFDDSTLAEIETLAQQPHIVSVGEIGLDYYRDRSPKKKQFAAFEAQLALAEKLSLPIIIHNRDASEDVVAILDNWVKTLTGPLRERPGVMHSFSAPPEIAERVLAMGFYLGFTGPVTFGKADDLRRVVAATPLNRILVETDGPFLTPHPYRGKRNESAYIPLIAERIATVKQLTLDEVASATTSNAVKLFNLPS